MHGNNIDIPGHHDDTDWFVTAALPRSQSTPGLLESEGRVALEDMWVSPLPLTGPAASPDTASLASCSAPRSAQPRYRSTESPLSELSAKTSTTIETERGAGRMAGCSPRPGHSPRHTRHHHHNKPGH